MKHSAIQQAFAQDWLIKIWISGVVGGVVIWLASYSIPAYSTLGFSLAAVELTLGIIAFGIIAYFGSLIVGSCLFPPLYRFVERLNGAPFNKGDTVEIMKKPYQGETAVIICVADFRYGALLEFEDESGNMKEIRLPWHSIRILARVEQDSAHQSTTAP